MTDEEAIQQIVRRATLAADMAFLGSEQFTVSGRMRDAVDAVIHCVLGNGLMQLVPPDDWPEYLSLNPPYSPSDVFNL